MISFDTFTGHDSGPQSPSSSSCGGDDTCASDSGAEVVALQQRRRRSADNSSTGTAATASDIPHDAAALAERTSLENRDSNVELDDARSSESGRESAEVAAPYDLFHERSTARPSRSSRRSRKQRKASSSLTGTLTNSTHPLEQSHAQQPHGQQQQQQHTQAQPPPESSGGGRVLQLFHLLTFRNQASDAKSALVQQLIAVTNVKELIMSKATEEQIAMAANDAITDEILASVESEDQRRQSVTGSLLRASGQRTPRAIGLSSGATRLNAALPHGGVHTNHNALVATPPSSSIATIGSGHYSPYRVLELVDVLDSTTGGMVKLILTNVRSRAPFAQPSGSISNKAIEFCSLCAAYSDHTASQHRCRICGVAGQHRSNTCPKKDASTSPSAAFTPSPPSSQRSSPSTSSSSNKTFCSFCSAVVNHTTQLHQCRNCGALGVHRSRSCASNHTTSRNSNSRRRWVGSPIEQLRERTFCELCNAWRHHVAHEHKCSICARVGDHRSKNCPQQQQLMKTTQPGHTFAANSSQSGSRTPALALGGSGSVQFCSFCSKKAAHRSEDHRCRVCHAVGAHRSGDCPDRKQPQSVLSYSVTTASKVFEKVLPASATSLVMDSIDKVGDVDLILKKTLQRLGVWGGGSQTPITTPYAPQALPLRALSSTTTNSNSSTTAAVANAAGVYVLSYAEGRSVVPERILKYMRLLMHHEISVNAFSVVVRFDPRSSHWELEKPGMVTPRSLPTSPTMSAQLQRRMANYTLQTLLDARQKLVALALVQRKHEALIAQQQQQQQQTHRIETTTTTTHDSENAARAAVAVRSS